MSSATSTEKARLKPSTIAKARLKPPFDKAQGGPEFTEGPDTTGKDPKDDQGFKPWHFFVLASLTAATVAVLMSRQSTPEHLVLISFTIGAAGAAAAGCYRMLAPLTITDAALLNASRSERARASIEREKALVLRSIKELEFDRAMGKVSPKDFDEMGGRLRARALMLMKQVDAGGSGYRELIERELSLRLTMRVAKVRLKPPLDKAQGGPEFIEGPDTTDDATQVRLKPDATDIEVRLKPDTTEVTRHITSEDGLDIGGVRLQPDLDAGSVQGDQSCDACGTANDPDAAFCKRCGTRLQAVHS